MCLATSGSVRATSMHHFDSWANVVQTFWPVTFQPPSTFAAFVFKRGEVGPRLGLGEPLAPDLLAAEDRLEPALLLLVGAVGHDHRAAHHQAEDVGRCGGVGAGHLAREDRLLDQGRAAAAELLGPRDPGPAALVQLASASRGGTGMPPRRRAAPGPGGWPPATSAPRRGRPSRTRSGSDPPVALLLDRWSGRPLRRSGEPTGKARGSIRTPGLRIPSGSTAALAAPSAAANGSGRCMSYQGR